MRAAKVEDGKGADPGVCQVTCNCCAILQGLCYIPVAENATDQIRRTGSGKAVEAARIEPRRGKSHGGEPAEGMARHVNAACIDLWADLRMAQHRVNRAADVARPFPEVAALVRIAPEG